VSGLVQRVRRCREEQFVEPWLVVGLGNPGPAYAGHRHNVGARCVAALAAEHQGSLAKHRTQALVGRIRVGTLPGGMPGPPAVLAVPQTFMNLSGGPVAGLARYYSIPVERIVVVHDELDIDLGAVRLKRGGGEGGHNGLRSVSTSLGTKDYARVRLGIGRPPGRQDPADYVLSNFPARDAQEAELLVGDGVDAVTDLIQHGLEAAQQRFHTRGPVPRA
jgi:PTH1 family peptidyl-tRNA hydrolase